MLKKVKGILKESYSCTVCGKLTNLYEYIYSTPNSEHFIMKCKICSHMFAKPVFIEHLHERKMDNIESGEMRNNSLLTTLYQKLILKKEIKIIKTLTGSKTYPKLLDIACGTGWTTAFYKENDFDVKGVEPSTVRAQVAKSKYGLDIYNCYFEDLPIDYKYDVIILRHIIEHFEQPKEMLIKVLKLLNDNGVLLIVVPNINCLGRYLFETKWSWIIPLHFNFFNMKSLYCLVKSCNLTVYKKYQTPSPLWFPKSFINSFPISQSLKNGFMKTKILKYIIILPFVVIGMIINMNDNLTIIAKKN